MCEPGRPGFIGGAVPLNLAVRVIPSMVRSHADAGPWRAKRPPPPPPPGGAPSAISTSHNDVFSSSLVLLPVACTASLNATWTLD